MASAYLDQLDIDIGSERTSLLPRCTPRRCGCGTILTVFLLGLGVIFPLSWQTLPYSEMGLDFNQISGKLDTSRAYERGRHLVGLGHVFITFPRTIQTIDFAQASELETETSLTSIPVISADGQMIRLECSVWYRLVPDKLGELYSKYATRYASNVAKAARQGITEASSLFDTVDFYQSRARVREAMKLAVAAALASYPVQFVDVWLWKCEVPSRLDEAIVNKLVTEQLKRTMRHRQAATLIGEQTQSLVARTAVSEARLLHAARAEAVLEVAVAEASQLATTTGALAHGMSEMAHGLGWGGRQALHWLWWDSARSAALRYIKPAASGATSGGAT